jgi:hypothetical protein
MGPLALLIAFLARDIKGKSRPRSISTYYPPPPGTLYVLYTTPSYNSLIMPFIAIDEADSYASSRGSNIYDKAVSAFVQAASTRYGTKPGASTYIPATMDHDYWKDRFAITSNGKEMLSCSRSHIKEMTSSRVFWRDRDGKCYLAELVKAGDNPDGTNVTQVLVSTSDF